MRIREAAAVLAWRFTLADPLAIVCEPCGRQGRYKVQRLIAAHGPDAKMTELLVTLANCEKARSFSIYDRCKAKFQNFSW
jgi:hypothetical protein